MPQNGAPGMFTLQHNFHPLVGESGLWLPSNLARLGGPSVYMGGLFPVQISPAGSLSASAALSRGRAVRHI